MISITSDREKISEEEDGDGEEFPEQADENPSTEVHCTVLKKNWSSMVNFISNQNSDR